MMLMEEDQRTFSGTENGRWNYLKDMSEVRAGLWRNLGASITRGYNSYPMDITSAASFYMDEGIQSVLAERRRVHEASVRWTRREAPSIVMVVDDWSVLDEDFTLDYQYLSMILQRLYGLSRCGVPFRLHLLEDLARDDFPRCHKVFLFPNLFRASPERLDLLRRKVFRNGNLAIFGPASGISDGKRLSAESATELTGIQWPSAYDGDGLVIREFGRGAAGNGRPGRRGAGDYAVLFSCAVPLPAPLLRACARYAGTHVYGEGDDLIFADSCTVAVHSVVPGVRHVRLPEPSTVWDLIRRRKIGDKLKRIRINVKPPQTDLFYIGGKPPM
jgi:hypothetical protein